ncbi:MAG: ornithine aminomutase [Kosmotoga sp.]|nr:MAG: ornithine aminomutase [Kosmotoga sp.]
MAEQRRDNFKIRSKHLRKMSDEELDKYFWELADRITEPLIDLAKDHTSPSIERSVLLRMGFNSLEAKAITDKLVDMGLLGKGAGHVVYRISKVIKEDIIPTGKKLASGELWDLVEQEFKGVKG